MSYPFRTLDIPAREYHAASKSGQYMSSHMLSDFRESPALYRKEIAGEITDNETPALALGRAAHCLILEGTVAFDRQYCVSDGPINIKTGETYGKTTKAYANWLASQTEEIISPKNYGFILKLMKSVTLHSAASELLAEGIAEGVIRTDYCGVPCQIRMDFLSPKHGLVDLKTCDSLKWFDSDCRRYGYIHQLAFYRAVIREATGTDVPVHIIAVEKNEPFSTGVWKLTDEVLGLAEHANKAALGRYRICMQTGLWPTGYEEIRIIDSI